MNNRPKTIFCDIDGTLIKHENPYKITKNTKYLSKSVLNGTIEKLLDWERKGYYIILCTGRKESTRKVTECQLQKLGIFYDVLIMGIGGGIRVLINDKKNNGDLSAFAINVDRNIGIGNINI